MKRSALLKLLRRHGCALKREGRSHSLWTNPQTGETESVPRHTEIPDRLARKICRGLSVPESGGPTQASKSPPIPALQRIRTAAALSDRSTIILGGPVR